MNNINTAVEFEAMFDINAGLLNLMKTKYNNPKYIKQMILDGDMWLFKCLSVLCKTNNILSQAFNDEVLNLIDQVKANIFYEKDDYCEVLENAPTTSIFDLFRVYDKINNINITVICKNESQQQYIKQKVPYFKTYFDKNKPIDISEFDAIYIRNIDDLELYIKSTNIAELGGKRFYILDYNNNYTEIDENTMIPKPLPIITLGDVNKFSYIAPYVDLVLPGNGINNSVTLSKLKNDAEAKKRKEEI